MASYSNKQKLLVVFDEFQEVAKYSEAGFEKRLRRVIQGHRNISYIFSGSQKHILIEMFDSAKRGFLQDGSKLSTWKDRNSAFHWLGAKPLQKEKHKSPARNYQLISLNVLSISPFMFSSFYLTCGVRPPSAWRLLMKSKIQSLPARRTSLSFFGTCWLRIRKKRCGCLLKLRVRVFMPQNSFNVLALIRDPFYKERYPPLIEKEIISKNDRFQFQDAMLKKWVQSLSWQIHYSGWPYPGNQSAIILRPNLELKIQIFGFWSTNH